MLATLGGCASLKEMLAKAPTLSFKPVPPGFGDRLIVPEGYNAQVIAAWGEPVGIAGQMPAFRMDASNTAKDQAVQMGMHHDGLVFFPLGDGRDRGLLAMNHE
jgi:secreted PhoX family phosphatase